MTIEELKAIEDDAWRALKAAEKAIEPLRQEWAAASVAREDAELRAKIMAELSPPPDSAHSPAAADSQPGAVPSCSCNGKCKG